MPKWKVGEIVSVEWPESRYGVALVGAWDGRVVMEDGHKITVRFEYPAYEDGWAIQRESEVIVIDLARGLDETYGERVIVSRPQLRVRRQRKIDQRRN